MNKHLKQFGPIAAAALFVVFVGFSMGLGMAEIYFYFGGKPL